MSNSTTGGYWLIEIDEMAPLIDDPKLHPIARYVLQWVASTVSDRLDLDTQCVTLTVINANYHGEYPCLAAKHSSGTIPDWLADQIESTVKRHSVRDKCVAIPHVARVDH